MSGIQYQEQKLILDNFMKGLVSRIADDQIPQDAMSDCLNVDMSQNDCVKSIKGFKKFNQNPLSINADNPNDTYAIKGGIVYSTDNFKEIVIVACGGYLWQTYIDKPDNFKKIQIDVSNADIGEDAIWLPYVDKKADLPLDMSRLKTYLCAVINDIDDKNGTYIFRPNATNWTKKEPPDLRDIQIDENSEPEFIQYGNIVFMVNSRFNIVINPISNTDANLILPNIKMLALYLTGTEVIGQDIARVKMFDPIKFASFDINTSEIPQGMRYLCTHNERIFGAYSVGGGNNKIPAEPNGIWWSEPYNPFNWKALYGLNYDLVGRDDGELISGIAKLNENYIYIFKPHSVYRYYTMGDITAWSSNRVDTNYGAIAHRTIKLFEGSLVYLSQEGVCLLNGNEAKLISDNIRDKFENADMLEVEDIRNDKLIMSKNTWALAVKLNGVIATPDNLTPVKNVYQGADGEILENEVKYSFAVCEKKGNLIKTENDVLFFSNRVSDIQLPKGTTSNLNKPPLKLVYQTNTAVGNVYTNYYGSEVFMRSVNNSNWAALRPAWNYLRFELIPPNNRIVVDGIEVVVKDVSGPLPSYTIKAAIAVYNSAGEFRSNLQPVEFAGTYYFWFEKPCVFQPKEINYFNFECDVKRDNTNNWDNRKFMFFLNAAWTPELVNKMKNVYTQTVSIITTWGDPAYSDNNNLRTLWSKVNQKTDADRLSYYPYLKFHQYNAASNYISAPFDLKLLSNQYELKQKLMFECLRKSDADYELKITIANYDNAETTFAKVPAAQKQSYTIKQNTGNNIDLNTGNFAGGFYYRYLKYQIEYIKNDADITISKMRFYIKKEAAIEDIEYPAEYRSDYIRIAVNVPESWGNIDVDFDNPQDDPIRFYIRIADRISDFNSETQWKEFAPNAPLTEPEGTIIQLRIVMPINSKIEVRSITLNFITSENDIYPCSVVWKGQYILNINDGNGGKLNNVSYILDKRGYWTKRDLEDNMIYFKGINKLLSGNNTQGQVYEDSKEYSNDGASYECFFITKRFRLSDIENLFKIFKMLYKSEIEIRVAYSVDEAEFIEVEIEPTPLNDGGKNKLNEIREVLTGIVSGQTIQFRFTWIANASVEIHKFELIWSVLRELNRR